MSAITLHQHWYGSAPLGLEVSRGFQTIAHSAGLQEFQSLKPHCAYKRPSGVKQEDLPVNWGWFHLDEKRVCLHQIAYADTDELGRPGNFLAHNLVADKTELAQIDHDIPLLLRWVEERSPVRYTDEDGRQSGFAGTYTELYAVLEPGADLPAREKLSTASPLRAPLAELKRLRQEMDRDWKGAFLDELRAKLNPDRLLALLQAFLCPEAQRRPVLLVGVGNGSGRSALERRVLEYLFSVLPFHCRRNLTFATYEHDVATALGVVRAGPAAAPLAPGARPLQPVGARLLPSVGAPGGGAPAPVARPGMGTPPAGGAPPALSANRNRRLIMTTTHNEVRLGGAGGGDLVWQWHTQTGAITMPPVSELGRIVSGWVKADAQQNILAFRALASRYDFPEEWSGLLDAWASRDLHHKPLSTEDYRLFLRLAGCCRPGQPHLLGVAIRLVQSAEEVLRAHPDLLGKVARAYLDLLAGQCEPLSETERAPRLSEAAGVVGVLFHWGVLPGNVDLLRYLLEGFSRSSLLLELRQPAANAFTKALEDDDHLERVEELLSVWAEVKGQVPEEAPGQLFLGDTANVLMALLERADKAGYTFSKEPERIVLPILRTIPVETVGQLSWRLGLLERLTSTPDLGGALLAALLRTGRLPERVLAELRQRPQELVLRHYREWRAAAASVSGPVQPLLGQAGLLPRYWESPADRAPHLSLPVLLADVQTSGQVSSRADMTRAYFQTGHQALVAAFQTDPRALGRPLLEALSEAHCGLLEFLFPQVAQNPEAGSLLTAHLVALLAFLLGKPRSRDWDESAGGAALRTPLRLLVHWFPAPESRVQLFEEAAGQVAALRERLRVAEEPLLLLRPLTAYLQQMGVEKGEAFWHAFYLNEATRQPDNPENRTRRTATRLLDQLPTLAESAARQTPFGQWLSVRLDREVFRGLARRLVQSLQGDDISQEAVKWFATEGGRTGLLAQMEAHGLLEEVAERLLQAHGVGNRASLAALGVLVNLPLPTPLAAPVSGRLRELLLARLDEVVKRTSYVREKDPEWWSPGLEDARRDIASLGPPMTAGGACLTDDWLLFFWDYLSRCLVTFRDFDVVGGPNTFRIYYPLIHSFGEAHQSHLGRSSDEVWLHLFHRAALAPGGRLDRFVPLFIQAAESLVAEGRLASAKQLADLRGADQLREVFWRAPIVKKKGASGPEDVLAPLLATTPTEAKNGRDNTQEARQAVFYRAQLAAVFYARESPAKLARVYVDLGFADDDAETGTSRFYASLPALALYAYLVMEGSDLNQLVRRRDAMLASKFWKPFFEGTRDAGRKLCASLAVWFEDILTPPEREVLLRPFWRQYGVEKR